MTALDAFLTALAASQDRLTWRVLSPGGRLRATSSGVRNAPAWCPLTAVAYLTHGQTLALRQMQQAGALLGLPVRDTIRIVHAADSARPGTLGATALRRRMLACLGVEELIP